MLGQRQPRIYNFLLVWPTDYGPDSTDTDDVSAPMEKTCLSKDLIQALDCEPLDESLDRLLQGPSIGPLNGPKGDDLSVIPCPWFSAFGRCPVLSRLGSCPFSAHGSLSSRHSYDQKNGASKNDGQKNQNSRNEAEELRTK